MKFLRLSLIAFMGVAAVVPSMSATMSEERCNQLIQITEDAYYPLMLRTMKVGIVYHVISKSLAVAGAWAAYKLLPASKVTKGFASVLLGGGIYWGLHMSNKDIVTNPAFLIDIKAGESIVAAYRESGVTAEEREEFRNNVNARKELSTRLNTRLSREHAILWTLGYL